MDPVGQPVGDAVMLVTPGVELEVVVMLVYALEVGPVLLLVGLLRLVELEDMIDEGLLCDGDDELIVLVRVDTVILFVVADVVVPDEYVRIVELLLLDCEMGFDSVVV